MTKIARTVKLAATPLLCGALAIVLTSAQPLAQTGTEWDSLYDRIIRLEHRLNSLEQGGGTGYQQPATPSYNTDPASSAALSLRIDEVEAQLRNLLGQVQELNHQMAQLTEQLRRFSEDAEFRFQQLESAVREGNADPLRGNSDNRQVAGLDQLDGLVYLGDTSPLEQYPQDGTGPAPLSPATGGQPGGTQVLGTLPLSALESSGAAPAVPDSVETQPLDGSSIASTGTGATAATPTTGAAERLYEQSYNELLRRKFSNAQAGFEQFLRDHGSHQLAPNAQYWLGETHYARGDFREAAAAFLDGYRNHPTSVKAPDSLLKLGMSLRNMGQREQACATFTQVSEEFPNAPDNIRNLATRESSRAGC